MLYNEALRPLMIYMREKVRKREETTWRINNESSEKARRGQRERQGEKRSSEGKSNKRNEEENPQKERKK